MTDRDTKQIQAYYSRQPVRIVVGVGKRGSRLGYVTVDNGHAASMKYYRHGSDTYCYELAIGRTVIECGSHKVLSQCIELSQKALKARINILGVLLC